MASGIFSPFSSSFFFFPCAAFFLMLFAHGVCQQVLVYIQPDSRIVRMSIFHYQVYQQKSQDQLCWLLTELGIQSWLITKARRMCCSKRPNLGHVPPLEQGKSQLTHIRWTERVRGSYLWEIGELLLVVRMVVGQINYQNPTGFFLKFYILR